MPELRKVFVLINKSVVQQTSHPTSFSVDFYCSEGHTCNYINDDVKQFDSLGETYQFAYQHRLGTNWLPVELLL